MEQFLNSEGIIMFQIIGTSLLLVGFVGMFSYNIIKKTLQFFGW